MKLTDLIWYLPLACGLVLATAMIRLGRSGSKLNRQAAKLTKLTEPLQNITFNGDVEITGFKAATEIEARQKRRSYLSAKAKRKEDKQRRLVERLRKLSKS